MANETCSGCAALQSAERYFLKNRIIIGVTQGKFDAYCMGKIHAAPTLVKLMEEIARHEKILEIEKGGI